jgi:dihydrofolate reductase
MGRTTFTLIGRPLPDRFNIILSRDSSFSAPDCQVARSLAEGLTMAEKYLATRRADEVMIIGGGRVYQEAIRLWDKLYLTVVEGIFSGTVFFPSDELCRLGGRLIDEESWPADERNPHPHSFYVIERDRASDRPCSQPQSPATHPLNVPAIFPRNTTSPIKSNCPVDS